MLMTIYWCGVGAYIIAVGCITYKAFKDPEIINLVHRLEDADIDPGYWPGIKVVLRTFIPLVHWFFAVVLILCAINNELWEETKKKVFEKAEEELCKRK